MHIVLWTHLWQIFVLKKRNTSVFEVLSNILISVLRSLRCGIPFNESGFDLLIDEKKCKRKQIKKKLEGPLSDP